MITLPGGIQTLLDAGQIAIRYMLLFNLDTGDQGAWNDTYSLSYNSVTYAPLAGNLTISEVPASSELDSDRITVSVSNLSNSVSVIIANENWHQRPCTAFVAFLDTAGAVQHVQAVFSGFLDDVQLTDSTDDLCTLTMTIESNSRELNRSNGRTRSDADQRRVSATDGFFKHAANAATDSSIYWGRSGPHYPSKAVVK